MSSEIAVVKSMPLVTNADLSAAKQKLALDRVRQARINSWIGFGVSKLSGVAGVVAGGLDILDPSVLPHALQQMHHPQAILGASVALLCGNATTSLLRKLIGLLP